MTVVEIVFDGKVYSLEAVKKAAYRNINNFSANISLNGSEILCGLSFKNKVGEQAVSNAIDNFKKDVLDQDLRESIKEETEGIRNLILAHAFSKTGLIQDE